MWFAGEFEVIWSIVNAKDRGLSEVEDKYNKDKALNRQELILLQPRSPTAVHKHTTQDMRMENG